LALTVFQLEVIIGEPICLLINDICTFLQGVF